MNDKQLVKRNMYHIDLLENLDESEKTFSEFIEYVKSFVNNIQRKYNDGLIKIKKEYVGHDGGYEVIIDVFTKETDVEYVQRKAKEKRETDKKIKEDEKKENADRQLYEELKKRFG